MVPKLSIPSLSSLLWAAFIGINLTSALIASEEEIANSQPASVTLDAIGLKAGTDKSSNYHSYTQVYDKWFHSFKDEPIKFLEIGIYKGHSAQMWEEYFTNAELHFIDISDKRIEYQPQRATYHFLDQSSRDDLRAFVNKVGGGFDLIIDDGGHTMEQQLASFKVLFPQLKPGGIYVIEDIMTSYWRDYGGAGTFKKPKASAQSMTEFVKARIDDLLYAGARTGCADFEKTRPGIRAKLNKYQTHIQSMHFYPGICMIIRR